MALLVPGAAAETLFFVGDGENVSLTQSAQGVSRSWPMALEGHGDTATTFELAGSQNEATYNSNKIPTFIYPGMVEISSDAPVDVYVYINDSNSLGCNGLDGQLFDGTGKALGPADFRQDVPGSGSIVEVKFSFKSVTGSFDGLAFQAASPWTDCGALPYTFHWGSDAAPGRIEFAAPSAADNGTDVSTAQLDPGLSLTFMNATTHSFVFNATSEDLVGTLDVQSGMANVTLDGNTTSYNASTEFMVPAGSGLNITFDAFVGSLVFAAPVFDAPVTNSTTTGSGENNATAKDSPGNGNETVLGNGTVGGKQSPGIALVPALMALAAIVYVRRR